MRLHEYQITPTSLLPAVAIALAAGIFVADTTTESEIAFPVFYTAIVLIAARFCTKRGIIFVGLGCIGLILLSDILTIDVSPSQAGIANTAISVVAIAATTYLAAKIQAEKETAYQARSQLAHVVRVTTLGEMTTSIAHQINQPLAAMAVHSNACLNWLEAEPPNLDEARKNITRIAQDADRANEIIVQVRNLTKGSPPERAWLQINEIIHSTIGFLDREIQEHQISLQTGLADNVPAVQGDRVATGRYELASQRNRGRESKFLGAATTCHKVRAARSEKCAHNCSGHRRRIRAGRLRPSFRCVLYDQAKWHGDGSRHKPFDR